MAKIIKKCDFRIEVTPFYHHETSEHEMLIICKDIENQIKRHVDEIDHVNVKYIVQTLCEYCGFVWEEDWDCIYYYFDNKGQLIRTMSPCCCDKAVREWGKEIFIKQFGE